VKALLALYPRWWRRRYGHEAAAALDEMDASVLLVLDLVRGAVDAWLRQRNPGRALGASRQRGGHDMGGRRSFAGAMAVVAIAAGVVVLQLIPIAAGVVIGGSEGARSKVAVAAMQRVTMPAAATVSFGQPGTYLAYYEAPGHSVARPQSPIGLAIVDRDGAALPLTAPAGSGQAYVTAGHTGVAVAMFTVARAGSYRVMAARPPALGADLAFGPPQRLFSSPAAFVGPQVVVPLLACALVAATAMAVTAAGIVGLNRLAGQGRA
jgi:hypothetical protein